MTLQSSNNGVQSLLHIFRRIPRKQTSISQRSHFYNAMQCSRRTRCPCNRCIKVCYLNYMKTTELLFCISIGTVKNLGLPIDNSNGGGRPCFIKTFALFQHPGVRHRFHVSPVCSQPVLFFI